MVAVNCAKLKGGGGTSAPIEHCKGAFTGAVADRPGLLRSVWTRMPCIDEVSELDLDEQAIILRGIENKRFVPVGRDKEARERYLAFAAGPDARWPGNFHDLAASVTRMATFSLGE